MPTLHPSSRTFEGLRLLARLVLPTALLGGCDGEPAPPVGFDISMRPGEPPPAVSQCVSLSASNDAMISNPPKAQNYGNHPLLRVGGKDESLLSFDLSSIPAGSTVDSATLRLYVNGSAGENPVNIHAATAAWSEGTVTYQSFDQQYDGGIAGVIQPASPNALKSADITGLVTDWLTGAQPNLGMLLETVGNKKSIFVSSEGAAAYAPSLEVCYTVPPTDYCAEDPCQNDGTCVNGDEGYTCECAPGFTGSDCELEIDECADDPCVNGDCTDQVAGYACACLPGYEGSNCETNTNECALSPCDNGGICTDGVNGYSCQCDAGFAGTDCELDIDECAGDPCQNGGECTDGVAGYSCACPAGYTGASCELDIDECAGALCENESACVDGVNGYTCSCLPGFEGVHCETNIDECAAAPCLNGGTCTDGIYGYACECAAGYTGDECQVDIDDCAAAPCVNGACVDGVDAYSCSCEAGWTGANCDEPDVVVTCPCADQFPQWNTVLDEGVAGATGHECYGDEVSGQVSYSYLGGTYTAARSAGTTCRVMNPEFFPDATGSHALIATVTPEERAVCLSEIASSTVCVDDCAANPCVNGSCIDAVEGYSCACDEGYAGTHCDEPDPCLGVVCVQPPGTMYSCVQNTCNPSTGACEVTNDEFECNYLGGFCVNGGCEAPY